MIELFLIILLTSEVILVLAVVAYLWLLLR
jgi:hypothetical protein